MSDALPKSLSRSVEATDVPAANDQTPERIRGMFGAITPTYDKLNRVFSGSLDERWRARAAHEALRGLDPCRRVLDLATGTGDLARALHRAAKKHHSHPIQIVGADFTRPMLRRAKIKLGGDPFHWSEADGLRLPYPDAAFDALTIGFGLRNMIDKTAALDEMARVVRPGGRVVILEFGQPRAAVMRGLYNFYSFQVMPRVGRWVSGSEAYGYLSGSIRGFWDEHQLAGAMRRAGLAEVRVTSLMFGVVYLHVGIKHDVPPRPTP